MKLMKLETYRSTPGLDIVPPGEQFSLYRSTHKRLMQEDTEYRKRQHLYYLQIVVLCLIPAIVGSLGDAAVVGGTGIVCILGVLFLAFRHQHHMNQKVGKVLQAGDKGTHVL